MSPLLGLLFPRIAIIVLYQATTWFPLTFDNIFLPLLGLLIAPMTLLCYAVVLNYFGGEWSIVTLIALGIAVLLDLGMIRGFLRARNRARA